MTRYEVIYDECDDWGEYCGIAVLFDGTWAGLQDYIKQLKAAGCYNISASALYDLDGSADELEARLNLGI